MERFRSEKIRSECSEDSDCRSCLFERGRFVLFGQPNPTNGTDQGGLTDTDGTFGILRQLSKRPRENEKIPDAGMLRLARSDQRICFTSQFWAEILSGWKHQDTRFLDGTLLLYEWLYLVSAGHLDASVLPGMAILSPAQCAVRNDQSPSGMVDTIHFVGCLSIGSLVDYVAGRISV